MDAMSWRVGWTPSVIDTLHNARFMIARLIRLKNKIKFPRDYSSVVLGFVSVLGSYKFVYERVTQFPI